MRMFVFDRIVSAVESLTASTEKVISVDGVEVRLSGMCSPHKSHRDIEFSTTPYSYGITVANTKHRLIFGYGLPPLDLESQRAFLDPDGICDIHLVQVPVAILGELPNMARAYLGVPRERDELVHVFVATRRVAKWDEDGKPIFAEPKPPEVTEEPAPSTPASD
jgi:hypothetical protein